MLSDQERDRILLRTLVALAWADGQVTSEETDWLERVLVQAGLPASEIRPMLETAVPVPGADELRQALPEREDRELFLKLALVVSLADGITSVSELEVIGQLARALDIPLDEVEQMRRETVVA